MKTDGLGDKFKKTKIVKTDALGDKFKKVKIVKTDGLGDKVVKVKLTKTRPRSATRSRRSRSWSTTLDPTMMTGSDRGYLAHTSR